MVMEDVVFIGINVKLLILSFVDFFSIEVLIYLIVFLYGVLLFFLEK